MSYDGWLVIDTGSGEPVEVVELGNCTTNVAPMWRKALRAAGADEGTRLSDTEGWSAEKAFPLLRDAALHMQEHPDEYRAMNPDNGWGDYEGALAYLKNVAAQCERHSKTRLHWWV